MSEKRLLQKSRCERYAVRSDVVRATGLEPARGSHQILSLARLPIPPRPHMPPGGYFAQRCKTQYR